MKQSRALAKYAGPPLEPGNPQAYQDKEDTLRELARYGMMVVPLEHPHARSWARIKLRALQMLASYHRLSTDPLASVVAGAIRQRMEELNATRGGGRVLGSIANDFPALTAAPSAGCEPLLEPLTEGAPAAPLGTIDEAAEVLRGAARVLDPGPYHRRRERSAD